MPTPQAAVEHYGRQRRVMVSALALAKRIWGHRPPQDFDAWFAAHVAELVATVEAGQRNAVADAGRYTVEVLDELGTPVAPEAEALTAPLVGVASDGRPLDSLLYGSIITTKAAVGRGEPLAAAWASGQSALLTRVQTQVADASRVAVGLEIATRRRVGYVRMLNPPSCSRCVVLAGRHYRYNAGFRRHPGCDCRVIPSTEATAGDLTVDPQAYFDSLSPEMQDKTFTAAGAEAIRAGADVSQVVNTRRAGGLYTASAYGRQMAATREGTTRRGVAYQAMTQARYVRDGAELKAGRYRGLRAPRLMPEAIGQIADDRDDYLRLLQLYGYIR